MENTKASRASRSRSGETKLDYQYGIYGATAALGESESPAFTDDLYGKSTDRSFESDHQHK